MRQTETAAGSRAVRRSATRRLSPRFIADDRRVGQETLHTGRLRLLLMSDQEAVELALQRGLVDMPALGRTGELKRYRRGTAGTGDGRDRAPGCGSKSWGTAKTAKKAAEAASAAPAKGPSPEVRRWRGARR